MLITDASTYLTGAPYSVFSAINGTKISIGDLTLSPILSAKSIKNKVEAEGMMNAHVRDSVALCKFAAHLEDEIMNSHGNWTEISAAELLQDYREQQKDNKGLSFHSISAYGSNGAIIHYLPTPETNKVIGTDGLYMRKFFSIPSIFSISLC